MHNNGGISASTDKAKHLILPVKSGLHYYRYYIISDRMQAYSSTIIQHFQLQNHEYCYSGVSMSCALGFSTKSKPIHLHLQFKTKFTILINSKIKKSIFSISIKIKV